MKIAPVPQLTPMVDAQAERIQNVRALKMSTNATPGSMPPTSEAPPEEALSKTDTDDPAEGTVEATQPLSPQLAALAKQKRALQVKERELADREKALASQPSTQDGHISLADLKSEPLRVLLENGVTYDQLTEAILADQNGGSEVRSLQAKVENLEKGIDEKLLARDQKAEAAVYAEIEREAKQLAAEGETFELVRATGSIPDVMKLVKRVWEEQGEVMTAQEALQAIEDELITESLKLAALKKVQGRLQPEAPPAPQPQLRPRTLTNRDGTVQPMTPKQRALLAFRGELKK